MLTILRQCWRYCRCGSVEPVVREKSKCNGFSPKWGETLIIFNFNPSCFYWNSSYFVEIHHIFFIYQKCRSEIFKSHSVKWQYIWGKWDFSFFKINFGRLIISSLWFAKAEIVSFFIHDHSSERWNWSNLQLAEWIKQPSNISRKPMVMCQILLEKTMPGANILRF